MYEYLAARKLEHAAAPKEEAPKAAPEKQSPVGTTK
jgi:hypothetical protein